MGLGQQGVSASAMWTRPLFEHDLPVYVLSWRANFNHQDSSAASQQDAINRAEMSRKSAF